MIGKLANVLRDYATGTWIVQIATQDEPTIVDNLKDKLLNITFKQYKEKRSNDANAMYWSLIGQLARVLGISSPEAHNKMLCLYGQPEIVGGGRWYQTIPDDERSERIVNQSTTYHLKPTSDVRKGKDGIDYRTYIIMRGSHTYDTAEFSTLLNGLIEECKALGIETESPDEIARMLAAYEEAHR